MSRIRVFYLTTGLLTGGAERALLKLVRSIDSTRFESVIVSMLDLPPRVELPSGVDLHSLGMRRGVPDPLAIPRLTRLLGRYRPDILQTWMYHADLLGLVAGKAHHRSKILWNVRCADMDMRHYSTLSSMMPRTLAALSRFPDGIVINSRRGLQYHESLGYRPQRWHVVPNGFDTAEFRPEALRRQATREALGVGDNVVIGILARVDPMKDHRTFLAAAAQVADALPASRFVLAGMGASPDNRDLSRRIGEFGLRDRVSLLGKRDDVAQLLAGWDILVLSSIGEAFPNVIGEAMSCGVPCVVTDVGDNAEIVGDTGRVVPPRNPEALAGAILELATLTPLARQTLGTRARRRIEERYGLETVTRMYEEIYTGYAAHH
ncbi:MAG: glycosyltransferase [Myxococcales bacterium]